MRYILPLILLAGLAGCAYNDGYAYQTTSQPAYAYQYQPQPTYANNGYYTQTNTTGYGSCSESPFVWKVCSESQGSD